LSRASRCPGERADGRGGAKEFPAQMKNRECPRSGARRGLLLFLLAALAVAAATSACKDPAKAKAEHISRGESYLKDKKYQEASLEFRNAVQIDDRSGPAHWGLARAYEGMGQFQQALEELQRAVQLDQNNLDARTRLGNFYIVAYQQTKDSKYKDEATRLAEEVLQRDPKNIEGHLLRGTIYFSGGDRERALAELNTAVSLDPNRVESYLGLALYYRQAGDPAKAEETYRKALSIDDSSSVAHLEYARFLVGQNRAGEAEPQFRRAVEVDPQSREAHRTLVSYYIQQKQLDRAEQAARALAALDSDKAEGTATLGDFYSEIGRTDQAVDLFRQTVSKFPDYPQGHYRLGELLLQKGDTSGAGEQAKAVLDKNPNDKQALLLRARVRLGAGDPKNAAEDLKQVLKQEPRDQAGLYYMADASLRMSQIDQARVFAGDLQKFYPDYLPAKLLQLQINLASGDWKSVAQQATDLIDKLDKAVPSAGVSAETLAEVKAKTLTARGMASLQTKDYARAAADLSAARDLQPNSPPSYTNLAAAAGAQGKADEATQFYERALQLDATNFDALNGLFSLHAARGEFDKAHARVDQALAQKPNDAPLHFLKGQIYGRQQDARGAEAEMRRALEIDPTFAPAFNALAALYINTNQPDQALASLRDWSARRPDDPTPYVLTGMLKDKQQDYAAANDAYRKALAIRPDDTFSANNLAWNYAEHGGAGSNLDEAMRLAQGVVQKYQDEPGFADTLGWVYFKKGLYAAAVEQLQKAVDRARARGSEAPVYRLHLGQALASAGRRAEARQQLQQALAAGKENQLTPQQADDARRALATLG
jgi:tetratricopeptide (TPR) repeat protein